MQGENIVCFSKDFGESSTSNHHVLLELARHNRVLWIESTATRTPELRSVRDRRRIVAKLRAFAERPRRETENLYRVTPLVLPWPHRPTARRFNRALVAAKLAAGTRALGMESYQLWTFLPTVADYLDDPRATVKVYYCVDEWSLFRGLDRTRIAEAEAELCRKVDVVFATSGALAESKRALHPHVVLAPHGVEHGAFARAVERVAPMPPELAAIRGPRIGFFGTLDDWFDAELVRTLAARRPGWSFVLVGPERASMASLRGCGNVHFLGPRPHAALPDYAAGFDVGMIPYRDLPRMRFVNPLKAREYLAAGLAVVSTPLPELAAMDGVTLVSGALEFEAALGRALDFDSPAERRRRSDSMRHETWACRVETVSEIVRKAKEERWGRNTSS